MVMNLACVNLRLTMPEALIAATLNAAAALGKSDKFGSVEKGKVADLIVINAPRWVSGAYSEWMLLVDYLQLKYE